MEDIRERSLRLFWKNAPVDTSAARAVKFTEKDLLPGAERQLLVVDKEGERAAHKGGHDVGGRVPFKVLVGKMQWHYFLQTGKDVIFDHWVKSFIDGQSSSGMGIKQIADPLFDVGPGDFPHYLVSDIQELSVAGGGDCNFSLVHDSLLNKKADTHHVCFFISRLSGLIILKPLSRNNITTIMD
jgi:hypothetical protein